MGIYGNFAIFTINERRALMLTLVLASLASEKQALNSGVAE